MLKGHGGNIQELAEILKCSVTEIIDMSSNLNPNGPPDGLVEHLKNNMDRILALPEVDSGKICSLFAKRYNLNKDQVIAGNGTTQFIYQIPKALKSKKSLIVAPTYSDYADSCIMNGCDFEFFFLEEKDNFTLNFQKFEEKIKEFDTIYICNPNNPTGRVIDRNKIKKLCERFNDKYFIIDESYLPFCGSMKDISITQLNLKNVIALNSMSKMYRIPGLRIGFLIAQPEIIDRFMFFMLPWSVNGLATTAVEYLMENEKIDQFEDHSRTFFKEELNIFYNELNGIEGLKLFKTDTYFAIAKTEGFKGFELCDYLKSKKILIRDCTNFKGLGEQFVRFSLKKRETNLKLTGLIKEFLEGR